MTAPGEGGRPRTAEPLPPRESMAHSYPAEVMSIHVGCIARGMGCQLPNTQSCGRGGMKPPHCQCSVQNITLGLIRSLSMCPKPLSLMPSLSSFFLLFFPGCNKAGAAGNESTVSFPAFSFTENKDGRPQVRNTYVFPLPPSLKQPGNKAKKHSSETIA